MSLYNKIKELVPDKNARIKWDDYFMSLAYLISSRSLCSRLNVGCVIVKDTRLISVGYNGFLPNHPHKSIISNNHEQATVHAEQNAISDCAKRGISCNGGTAYITHYPCLSCFKSLAASGISKIIYDEDYRNDESIPKININIEIIKM